MTMNATVARPTMLDLDLTHPPLWETGKRLAQKGWNFSVRVLNKHTDLISSLGILAITTCLLAAKIFKNIPSILPRLANVVFNYGGIIWLNVQVRDFIKSCRDWGRVVGQGDWQALLETTAKVFVKGVNILLTCAFFGASVAAAVGFPQLTLALHMAVRPLSLTSLAINIAGDVRDYFANEEVLKQLDSLETDCKTDRQIAKVMGCFLEIVMRPKHVPCRGLLQWSKERKLADFIVRQLDTYTLETFQEGLGKKRALSDVRQEVLKLFYNVQDSMRNRQANTKANLFLTVVGYVSMGICRAFPETVVEKATRFGMSVMYTDELIRQKLFQADLAESF